MPQKPLIEGDPFETMCALAQRFAGQPVGLVYDDESGQYCVGVIGWADLEDGDWMKRPAPIAQEAAETAAVPSTDQA